MSADKGVTYIETDLDEMANEKKSLVAELDKEALNRENYRIVSLNILDQEKVSEVVGLFKDGPVAIIHEGLLPYLSPEEKAVAAKNIHAILSRKGGVWITPDLSNSGRMRKIIELFPGAAEAVAKISTATNRDMKGNSIGDKEAVLQFYAHAGFNMTEYPQRQFVPILKSLDLIPEQELRESVDDAISVSGIWVLEVSKED